MQGIFFRDFYNDHITEIFKEIYFEKLYDHLAVKGGICVDVGANVGLFTYWAILKGFSHTYAVEPALQHLETLRQFIDFNGYDELVTLLPVALSNVDGEATFYHSSNTTTFSLIKADNNDVKTSEQVKTETLETLMRLNKIEHIDLLKVDTEGEEYKIFSSVEFLKMSPKIDTIITEYHAWTGIAPVQLVLMLQDAGYKVNQLKTEALVLEAHRI